LKNSYEIHGDVTAIFINSPKHGFVEVFIDTADLERVSSISGSWYVALNDTNNKLYVRGWDKGKKIHLHRLITNAQDGLVVDHVDGNPLNNTRINLRVCTVAENCQNHVRPSKGNKSGVLGVCWHQRDRRWRVQCNINGKRKYMGGYKTLKEAAAAAQDVRAKYMPFSLEARIKRENQHQGTTG